MKKYIARIEVGSVLETIEFETSGNPIEYLWERYGVSSFIESISEVE